MIKTHCDHCDKVIEDKAKEIVIRIGNYEDKAELCGVCMGRLMNIAESFLNGDEFVRSDD